MITEQPKTREVKIRYTRCVEVKVKRPRRGYCRACGCKLTDSVSIERGYGRECWNSFPVIIVLDIPKE